MNLRAYSMLNTKGFDSETRSFSGIATSPTTDRIGDTINPMGARFNNPIILLHQHDHKCPIGTVELGDPSKDGIGFVAKIAKVEEPGPLKDRVDLAWGEIKHGLVRAVSIGFRPLSFVPRSNGGLDFQEIEIFELSAVTIPANAEAMITAIKSFDTNAPALPEIDPALVGKASRVVRLGDAVRRAAPFVINRIVRTD